MTRIGRVLDAPIPTLSGTGGLGGGLPSSGGGGGDVDTSTFLTNTDGGGDVFFFTTATSTATIDIATGNVQDVTLTDDCTFTFTAVDDTRGRSFAMFLRQDSTGGWDATWPGSVVWAGGSAPILSNDPGGVDVFVFITLDGGISWYGFPTGGTTGGGGPIALDDLTDVSITTPAEGHEIRYRSGSWVNEIPGSVGRWEVVLTGSAPPEPVTNEAEDDWLYAEV